MSGNSNETPDQGLQITLDIPLEDSSLLSSEAIDDILFFLMRRHDHRFSISEVTDAVQYSRSTVSKTIDRLANNDLIFDERDGQKRLVQINTNRVSGLQDPILEIPQAEYRPPVDTALDTLTAELNGVLGIVLYGSVARGEADRRSDIDLWVLVGESRMENQRLANELRRNLEAKEYDQGRFKYEIDVEVPGALDNYEKEIFEILTEGISIYKTDEFDTFENIVLHDNRE